MSDLNVVFGTGAIGRAVAEELVAKGKSVRMVNRSGEMKETPKGVEVVGANLFNPSEVHELCKQAKVVYQAAQPEYQYWEEQFPRLQQSIIDGLTDNFAKLVLIENLYMYGAPNGVILSENLPYDAKTKKGKIRAELSKAALEAHKEGKIVVTIGRGSDYFGPWGVNSSMGERVFYPLLEGKPAQVFGRADIPHTHTFTRDFGKALVILGEHSEADGQAWHVPNDKPRITQAELIEHFAKEAGVKPEIKTMGKFMLMLGGLFVPDAKETIEMLYEFEQPFIVDSSKFENTFNMKATPIREAVRETLNWYRSHPRKQ